MNTAEYLLNQIKKLGIDYVFGVAEKHNSNLLSFAKSCGLNPVICVNELNAGCAADGYARENGYGVLITSYGQSELTAINAVAGCYAENIAILNIAGLPKTEKNTASTQTDFCGYFKDITGYTVVLNRDNAKLEIDKALKILVNQKLPVYIGIPEDIALLKISDKNQDYFDISDDITLKEAVNKIRNKLCRATHPVIIADSLIERYNSKNEFNNFVKVSGIAAVNFMTGNYIEACDECNYLGNYCNGSKNEELENTLKSSDCILVAGAGYCINNNLGIKFDYEINSNIAIYGTYTYIDGIKYENVKMCDLFKELSKDIEPRTFEKKLFELQDTNSNIPEEKITPEYLFKRLSEYIDKEDCIYCDKGSYTTDAISMTLPQGAEMNIQAIWNTPGWATSAALGAGIAAPQKNIILITGESSHQISAFEVGNMIKYGLKPVIIIINNGGKNAGRIASNDLSNEIYNVVNIDYTKLARALGQDLWSTKVETASDFDKALRVTKIMNKLCYIEVCIEKSNVTEFAKDAIVNNSTDSKLPVKNENNAKQESAKSESVSNIKISKPDAIDYSTHIHLSLKDIENNGES